jgi:plasmid stabilization system protein ParE
VEVIWLDRALEDLNAAYVHVAAENPAAEKDGPAARRKPGQRGPAGKRPVVEVVERGGMVRTFHVDRADKDASPALCARTSTATQH